MKWRDCKTEIEQLAFTIGEGVYCIRCLQTDQVYYGNTNDIKTRYQKHHWYLLRGKHPNKGLQKDFDKYGFEGFQFEVVYPTGQKEDRHFLEHHLITEAEKEGQKIYNVKVPIKDKYPEKSRELKEKIKKHSYEDIAKPNYLLEVV